MKKKCFGPGMGGFLSGPVKPQELEGRLSLAPDWGFQNSKPGLCSSNSIRNLNWCATHSKPNDENWRPEHAGLDNTLIKRSWLE
jgi:hypothetical protein